MTFLAAPLRLTRDDMVKYILALPKAKLTWKPRGITLHNAGEPNLKQWAAYTEADKVNWGVNYDYYCRVTQHWHSGPHFIGTPEAWSTVLCDPLADGVHASCFNRDHYGVETVGDFSPAGDDPTTGAGLAAMRASANILAALCAWQGWDPKAVINFHRECRADGHACPGSRVSDAYAIDMVKGRLAEIKGAPIVTTIPKAAPPAPSAPVVLPVWPTDPADPFFGRARTIFSAWRALGVSVPFAIAMVTQAEFESAFRTDVVGDHGTAHNVYQWHAARAAAIFDGTGINVGSETDLTKVVAAAWWELNHTEIAAREAIAAATTASAASRAACALFEGAGAADAAERRAVGAERWSVYFAEHPL